MFLRIRKTLVRTRHKPVVEHRHGLWESQWRFSEARHRIRELREQLPAGTLHQPGVRHQLGAHHASFEAGAAHRRLNGVNNLDWGSQPICLTTGVHTVGAPPPARIRKRIIRVA